MLQLHYQDIISFTMYRDNISIVTTLEGEPINVTSSSPDAVSSVLLASRIVIGVLLLLVNSLTMVTIAKCKFLHTVTNVFVFNLALSDCLLAFPVLYQQYLRKDTRYEHELHLKHITWKALLWLCIMDM